MELRTFKVLVCVWCACAAPRALAAPRGELYLDLVDLAAISRMTPRQLEVLAEGLAAEEIMRTKRSSAQAVSSAVSKASSGLQSKLGLLGQASAFISSASSKSGDEHHGYSYEPHHDEKYDYWGLKKSILYTLFQAVKAITGGVTILKGQLIKGGGALASTLGKVIAGKGDAVSNLGKKIVSSAALSEKKPHSTAVYGPPPTHVEYGPPAVYGAPTAPAHYHTGPSLPTGYAAHKYPSTLDGRGVQAGVVLLAPLGEPPGLAGHTALDPPPSVLHSVFGALKQAFSGAPPPSAPPALPALTAPEEYAPPPAPPVELPASGWAAPALDSYGAPAAPEAYTDYDPHRPHPPFHSPPAKYSAQHKTGLTPDKIQKINFNLAKLNEYMSHHQARSSDLPELPVDYRQLLKKGPLAPAPSPADDEIGVLPAELLPELDAPSPSPSPATPSPSPATPGPGTRAPPVDTRRTDYKYFLRGNRIVLV